MWCHQEWACQANWICDRASLLTRYQKYLYLARTENLSDIAALDTFYKSGCDYLGRQVIVFVGNKFPAPKVSLSKVSCV